MQVEVKLYSLDVDILRIVFPELRKLFMEDVPEIVNPFAKCSTAFYVDDSL